jgi:molybdopterin biosynthesis enzyme MoaB
VINVIKTAILTMSDKGSKGERIDETGPGIRRELEKGEYEICYYKIIPDEKEEIEKELINICDNLNIDLVLRLSQILILNQY